MRKHNKMNKKLDLNTQTVRDLRANDLETAAGGGYSGHVSCYCSAVGGCGSSLCPKPI